MSATVFQRQLAGMVRRWGIRLLTFCLAAAGSMDGLSPAYGQQRYREPYRPQFHFTPERNWMNDPNGMVFYDGEWHLFYQYNPAGNTWGHMSWGHAVSRDLVHWQHLPLALAEEDGVMIFSGSAVVDWKNTSGFGQDGKPPLVAIYTGHREGRQDQRLAFSNDRGRTWTKFSDNPVLDLKMADFRDPKVFWHAASSRWIMTVALATEKKVHFYSSPDLKKWKYVGEFGPAGAIDGLWECPDLFPLRVGGDEMKDGETKWVLIVNINPGGPAGGSGCQYFVGSFDGQKFTADPPAPSRAEFVPAGKVLADFEEGYGDWIAEGEAFGKEPASGTLPNQQPVTGFRGRGLVNSFRNGDQTQGTLTSPEFEINAKHISFLIGGGAHAETRVDLLVDGKAVRTATGRERERLVWQSWDVAELRGKTAQLQVVDKHSGSWGHINLDHVLLADEPARAADDSPMWADFGTDFYAAVSWSDVPQRDGRRVWLGWMSNWLYANDVPTSPWRSAMTIPRELRLKKTDAGIRLVQAPVAELQKLRGARQAFQGGTVADANAWLKQSRIGSNGLELLLTIAADSAEPVGVGPVGVKLHRGKDEETLVGVDRQRGRIYLDRTRSGNVGFHPKFAGVHYAPFDTKAKEVKLHIFADTSSVEVFVNGGEQVISSLVFPSSDSRGVQFFGEGGATELDAWPISSSWQ